MPRVPEVVLGGGKWSFIIINFILSAILHPLAMNYILMMGQILVLLKTLMQVPIRLALTPIPIIVTLKI